MRVRSPALGFNPDTNGEDSRLLEDLKSAILPASTNCRTHDLFIGTDQNAEFQSPHSLSLSS
jgi:hypothetical protein